MIEPAKRSYDDETKARLVELFGAPERWGRPPTTSSGPSSTCWCPRSPAPPASRSRWRASYDLELAAAKYLYSLPDGEVPLPFNFTGTIFYRGEDGRMQIGKVPWDCRRASRCRSPPGGT